MATDYEAEKDKTRKFLAEHYVQGAGIKLFKYGEQLMSIAHREETTLTIDIDDVQETDPELAEAIVSNTQRYTKILADSPRFGEFFGTRTMKIRFQENGFWVKIFFEK